MLANRSPTRPPTRRLLTRLPTSTGFPSHPRPRRRPRLLRLRQRQRWQSSSRRRRSARSASWQPLLGKVKLEKQAEEKAPEIDELEQYLADTDVPDIDDPILDWWKVKARKWPALGKMVKQYFAAPASSAGVECVFSAAGKMHGDLQKSAKDTTLERTRCSRPSTPTKRWVWLWVCGRAVVCACAPA
jgi:hypothetical protein